MKPSFARRKYGAYRSGRKRRACPKLLAFLLATLAARALIRPAFGQYTCPPSCTGLTLNSGTQSINSGGTASGTTLNNTAQQGVFAGGVASATTVNSAGGQFVLGGTAVDTTVNDNGFQEVDSGSASVVTINPGGAQYVFGGAVSNTIVNGGYQEIDAGTVTGTVISNGGDQHVNGGAAAQTTIYDGLQVIDGGTATDTVVSGGTAEQDIFAGSAVNTTVNGGAQYVFSGGAAVDSVVLGSGVQSIFAGGVASNTSVSSGGTQLVSSGGTASATILGNAGNQLVSNGGRAIGATVNSGGVQTVSNGGIASSTTVANGGNQTVDNGGLAIGTTVGSGGVQNVASGGVAVDTLVSSGGIEFVSSGGIVQPAVVRQGGSVVNYGAIVFNPAGTMTFDGTLTGGGSVMQQGAGTTILTGDNHAFAGATTVESGTLMVGDLANASASLGGDVAVASAGTLRGHGSIGNNVVNDGTVMPGGTIGTLSINGNYTQTANGALVVEVSPVSGSQLKVNGTATLEGKLRVLFDPGSYSARSYAILAASAINGKFDGLSAVTSAGADLNGLAQSVDYSPTQVELVLAHSTATIAPLDTSIYTALGSTAVQGALAFDRALLDRLVTAPATAHRDIRDGPWATLADGYLRADGSGTASAFGAHRAGFAAGYDHRMGSALIGGAVGYEHDEISESTTPSSGRLDAIRLAAYGSRMFGAIETSGVFGYTFAWATDKRPFGTGSNSAPEGNHWLQSLSGTAQAGIPVEIARDTVFEPRAGLHWAWMHGQAFTESGGGGQDLAVGADTVHSAQPYLGLTLMHAFGTSAQPVNVYMDVEYAREMANRARTVTVFSQDGTAFVAPGAPLAHHIVSLGAGVHAQFSPSWWVSGDASTQLRGGSMVHLQLGYRF
ncbi:MAG TPA: autotransporter domain-containing protein [Trinickia sp.]|uniref:autotransporter domain-containing protein n=1 Tax=Trinickia sp. TaxID=2571163 RepID=UPI002B9CD4E1|nr:autotransporter domain-containing protein [Trinickia sp.]HVW50434.1 autotransporter domain-containing protein [Trinickia sp.]